MGPMEDTLLQWQDAIRQAARTGQALRIRGGGTKDGWGQAFAGAVFDTRSYTGVVAYEPTELVVTVRAGTPLNELEALLATQGQHLAFEPPRLGHDQPASATTVGGMVACGLSGPARASVGAVRDFVLGVGLINGRGEHLTFGGQVMKNVAGYDVSRLMVGAMGTLGVLTEVSIKVLPLPPAQATLRWALSAQQALDALNGWGGKPLPLNASCWVPDDPLSAPAAGATGHTGHTGHTGRLWLRLQGAAAAVSAACARLGGERVPPTEADAFWTACRDQRLPFFNPVPGAALWRLSVPQTAPDLPWPHAALVEWHGAQRWVWAPADQAAALRTAVAAVGGHATLFRVASDRDRAVGVWPPLAAPLADIHRRMKAAFDPAGVLCPGRMVSGC